MCSALTISFLNSIAVDKLLRDALCGVPFLLRVFLFSKHINPNRSLDRICLDLLLSSCFLTAFVRLPTSALSFHLAVARYAFDETSAHLLNNRTKSVKESNDRFGINEYRKRKVNIELLTVLEHHCEGNRLALLFLLQL